MNPIALLSMLALLSAGIGVAVLAYATPLGVARDVLTIVATRPRVWRLR